MDWRKNRFRPEKFVYLGYGFIRISNISCFQSATLFSSASNSLELINYFFLFSIAASVVAHFAFAVLSVRRSELVYGLVPPLAIAAFMSAGLCLVSVNSLLGSASLPVLAFGAIVHGVSWAWLDVLWVGLYGSMPPHDSSVCIIESFLASFVLWFILLSVAGYTALGLLLNLVLIGLSGLMLGRGLQMTAKQRASLIKARLSKQSREAIAKALRQPLIAMSAFALAYSFLDRICSTDLPYFTTVHVISIAACTIGALCLLMYVGFGRRKADVQFIARIVFPLLVVGCILFPAFGGFAGMFSTVLVAVGFMIFDIVMVAYVSELAYEQSVNGAAVEGIVRGVIWLFCGIGGALGYYAAQSSLGFVVAAVIAAALVYLVIGGFMALANQKAVKAFEDGESADELPKSEEVDNDDWRLSISEDDSPEEEACDHNADPRLTEAAREFGLTARELDVLSYLVRGYTLANIAPKLFLSEHTVRTHVRHIYEKMGVHSRQELLEALGY